MVRDSWRGEEKIGGEGRGRDGRGGEELFGIVASTEIPTSVNISIFSILSSVGEKARPLSIFAACLEQCEGTVNHISCCVLGACACVELACVRVIAEASISADVFHMGIRRKLSVL